MNDSVLPKLILSDPPAIASSKHRLHQSDQTLDPAYQHLRKTASRYLPIRAPRVTDKVKLPPSDDPHDYMSMSVYHWPNPDTADGLPYIRRDGRINPEAGQTDLGRFQLLAKAVPALGWAYFLSEEPAFGEKGIEMIKVWFLDESTRMNPHLRYGGHVPGVVDGRSYGLTDTKSIRFILDTVGLLRADPQWTDAEEEGMQAWVSAYLEWLLTSTFGEREFKMPNNHGTWCDVQILSSAMFVGDQAAVEKIAESVKARIATQFTPDGAQPEEMKRTRPLQYCMMNLQGFFELATMLSHCGYNIWDYTTPDGKSLRNGAEWLLNYAVGDMRLAKDDLVKATPQAYFSVFRRAAIQWADPRFEEAMHRIDPVAARNDLLQIQYPLEL